MISSRFCRYVSSSILKNRRILNRIDDTWKRTLLSEAYQCNDTWKKRLQNPLFQNIDVEDFGIKIQDKFDKEGHVSPVDIDIFAIKLEQLDKRQLDFALHLLSKFRHTRQGLKMLQSTHYAVVRTLLECDEIERLLLLLKDKINYGIFLDDHISNMLMDYLLEQKRYDQAARIAYEAMLQEDFIHPAKRLFALYSCVKRLKDPDFMNPVVESEQPADEAKDNDDDEEDEEEIIRVNFIAKPYYDDHFDLHKESLLLGKTLMMITSSNENLLERSYQLIGSGLYEKYQQGLDLLQQWVEDDHISEAVTQESLYHFTARLEAQVTQEPPEEKDPGLARLEDYYPYVTNEQKVQFTDQLQLLAQKLKSKSKIVAEADFEAEILASTKEIVSKVTEYDIKEQEKMFKAWEEERENCLKEQIAEIQKIAKKLELVKRVEQLQDKEERLRFFEEKNKIHLAAKKSKWIPKITEVEEEEVFVPPPQERGKNFQG